MTTACIVQARMASTRLPAKVLKDLAGEPVLGHVLRRSKAIPGVDVVVCATVESADCEPIAALAQSYGAEVYRGSETDVLDRYTRAARAVDADVVMRVTSDCPLIDPGVCGEVIALRAKAGVDYAANNYSQGFPHGLDCDAFTRGALERAHGEAREAHDREHVTTWMKRQSDLKQARIDGPGDERARYRWTLDYPEDLAFFRALFCYLPNGHARERWTEIAAVQRAHPELGAINAARHHR
jgi:spore coat polysaccharide biosynthesis protein SpsF